MSSTCELDLCPASSDDVLIPALAGSIGGAALLLVVYLLATTSRSTIVPAKA